MKKLFAILIGICLVAAVLFGAAEMRKDPLSARPDVNSAAAEAENNPSGDVPAEADPTEGWVWDEITPQEAAADASEAGSASSGSAASESAASAEASSASVTAASSDSAASASNADMTSGSEATASDEAASSNSASAVSTDSDASATSDDASEDQDAGRLDFEAIYCLHEPDEAVLSIGETEACWGDYFYLLYSQCGQIEDYFNTMSMYYGMNFHWDDPVEEQSV